jgi:hypothetical protein
VTVPVGGIFELKPAIVAVRVAVEPAFTGFGADCKFMFGVANVTLTRTGEEVDG